MVDVPNHWNNDLHPFALTAAAASREISVGNEKIALELERYVLPHDTTLRSAYNRFNVSTRLPYFEFEEKDLILAQTLQYLDQDANAERLGNVSALLNNEAFPSTWEDQIAISSLSSLLIAFTNSGYNDEAELASDSISNFILYQATKSSYGSDSLQSMVATANQLAHCVRNRKKYQNSSHQLQIAFGQSEGITDGMSWDRTADSLKSEIDIARRSYLVLSVAARRDPQEMQSTLYTSALRQISNLILKRTGDTRDLFDQIENLFTLSSLAVLCEAANIEALSAEPRILLSGPFIRHLSNTILRHDLQNFDPHILEPIANAISTIVRLEKWSAFRDPVITKLLSYGLSAKSEAWGLINLAVEREHLRLLQESSDQFSMDSSCASLCRRLMAGHNEMFQCKKQHTSFMSVDRGYLGLLRKLLEGDDLASPPRTNKSKPCPSASSLVASFSDHNGDNLLHRAAKRAYLPVTKVLVECLGTVQSKPGFSKLDMDGLSPLHLACKRRGDLDTVLLYIYAGADLDLTSSEGRTALHYCFPSKGDIHDYLDSLLDLFQDHRLLTTLPVEPSKIYGTFGAGREVNNVTFTLRKIIRQLCCRGASTIIQDQWGASPGHLAAANGWGTNVDMFFIRSGDEAENMIQECLCVRDKENNSVLAAMRMAKDIYGEKIFSGEMKKRCIYASVADNPQTTPRYLHSSQSSRNSSASSPTPHPKPAANQRPVHSPSISSRIPSPAPPSTFPRDYRNTGNFSAVSLPQSPPPPSLLSPPGQPLTSGYSNAHAPVVVGRQTHPYSPTYLSGQIPIRPGHQYTSDPYNSQHRPAAAPAYPPQRRPQPDYRQPPLRDPPTTTSPNNQQTQPESKNRKGFFKNVLNKK
jgi:hypothetical protein